MSEPEELGAVLARAGAVTSDNPLIQLYLEYVREEHTALSRWIALCPELDERTRVYDARGNVRGYARTVRR
jgi:hypothetical protein